MNDVWKAVKMVCSASGYITIHPVLFQRFNCLRRAHLFAVLMDACSESEWTEVSVDLLASKCKISKPVQKKYLDEFQGLKLVAVRLTAGKLREVRVRPGRIMEFILGGENELEVKKFPGENELEVKKFPGEKKDTDSPLVPPLFPPATSHNSPLYPPLTEKIPKIHKNPPKQPPSGLGLLNDLTSYEKQTSELIIQEWNRVLGMKRVEKLTPYRKSKLSARIKTHPEPIYWKRLIETIKQCPYLLNESWFCFDWVIKSEESLTKVLDRWLDWKRKQNHPYDENAQDFVEWAENAKIIHNAGESK